MRLEGTEGSDTLHGPIRGEKVGFGETGAGGGEFCGKIRAETISTASNPGLRALVRRKYKRRVKEVRRKGDDTDGSRFDKTTGRATPRRLKLTVSATRQACTAWISRNTARPLRPANRWVFRRRRAALWINLAFLRQASRSQEHAHCTRSSPVSSANNTTIDAPARCYAPGLLCAPRISFTAVSALRQRGTESTGLAQILAAAVAPLKAVVASQLYKVAGRVYHCCPICPLPAHRKLLAFRRPRPPSGIVAGAR
ncbi:hypothetical protein EJ02DRAFT_266267 [Clathrospora elynae]|uniref:Uncharacterized protein n=1 Tax=Clathrospora elynae TaxID=706981 RepID=A0A6A5SHG2_9PLEO|nr:hypothetical protein EJ02DRAFT_266267 [Clathrospora elynae]